MMTKLEQARAFAEEAHGDQKRKFSGHPYISHPIAVSKLAGKFCNLCAGHLKSECMIVGLLHDVVEDTDVSLSEIANTFGGEIADAVYFLTKQEGCTYLDQIKRVQLFPISFIVKICDIRHNMSDLNRSEHKSMYDKYDLALHVLETRASSYDFYQKTY